MQQEQIVDHGVERVEVGVFDFDIAEFHAARARLTHIAQYFARHHGPQRGHVVRQGQRRAGHGVVDGRAERR